MKKIVAILALFSVTAALAGGEPTQGLVHRHIVQLSTLAAAKLPPKEEVLPSRPLSDYIHDAYDLQTTLKYWFPVTPYPKDLFGNEPWRTEHFWYEVKNKRNCNWLLTVNQKFEELPASAVYHTDAPNNHALIVAARHGLINEVKKHCEAGADAKDYNALSFLLACKYGHTEVVKFLLEHGADANAGYDFDYQENSALGRASKNNHTEVVKLLIKYGAKIDANYHYALITASGNGNTELVNLLLTSEEDIHAMNDGALNMASAYGHLELVKYLLNHGADIHADRDAALRLSSSRGYLDVVRYLLEHGANAHTVDNYPLIFASEKGHIEIVKLLLAHGADPHASDDRAIKLAANDTIKSLLMNKDLMS